MQERHFQSQLIKELRHRFHGCLILKNDPELRQGIPDLTVFYKDRWAMLEVKADKDSPQQANQEYYVDEMNAMSFAAFIYPSNQEDVLADLKRHFRSGR